MKHMRHQRAILAALLCLGIGVVILEPLRNLSPVMKAGAFVLVLAATAAFIWRLDYSAADLRHRRRMKGQCPECGYDIRHNVSGRCPECGKGIESG